jgi:hypothetical protein
MKYHPTLWTDAASARAETNLFVNDCLFLVVGAHVAKAHAPDQCAKLTAPDVVEPDGWLMRISPRGQVLWNSRITSSDGARESGALYERSFSLIAERVRMNVEFACGPRVHTT